MYKRIYVFILIVVQIVKSQDLITNPNNDYGNMPDVNYDYDNISYVNHGNMSENDTPEIPTCESEFCLSKCCEKNTIIDFERGCVNLNNISYEQTLNLPENYELVVHIPAQLENHDCSFYEEHEWQITSDGSLYVPQFKTEISYENYCVDYVDREHRIQPSAVICYHKQTKSQYLIIFDKIHFVFVILSVIFLFAILLLHILTSHCKKDLQTKCTIASCLNLMAAYICTGLNMSPIVITLSLSGCVALGIITQFFYLSFFFWLCIMCFEIARIIRGTMRLLSIHDLTGRMTRFYIYCFVTWGSAFVICAVTAGMQNLPARLPADIEPYIIRPKIGHGSCWFTINGYSKFVYFYGIQATTHIMNSVFMCFASFLIYKDKILSCFKRFKSLEIRIHVSRNFFQLFKQQLLIYLLYICIWLLDALSLIHHEEPFWRVLDLAIAIQGVFLFFIVIRPKQYFLVKAAWEKVTKISKEVSTKISSISTSSAEISQTTMTNMKQKTPELTSNENGKTPERQIDESQFDDTKF